MSSPYTPSHLATGVIRRAIARLAGKYPFHARVLEKFKLVPSQALDTMGVTARADGVLLLFNPEFTLALPVDELGGVLLHEVHHVVLGHLALDPADYPDEWAFVVSLELSVNEFVKEPLPKGAVVLEDFPALPPMESSRERYRRLERQTARMPLTGSGGVALLGGGKGSAAMRPGIVVDDHGVWQQASPQGMSALADLVQEAALEAGGMPEDIRRASRLAGTVTTGGVSLLVGDRPGNLDWRTLLRRYAGRILEPGPSFTRPPRRFPDLVGVWPGRKRVEGRAAVVAVIDTSGSITDAILEAIDGELHRLSRSHTVQVVECDCAIHRVYRYAGRLDAVHGRGGTDFRPALERAFLRPLRPDLVVYFTDGFGPAPEKGPPCPLIWCLTPGGETPAIWGRIVEMDSGPAE